MNDEQSYTPVAKPLWSAVVRNTARMISEPTLPQIDAGRLWSKPSHFNTSSFPHLDTSTNYDYKESGVANRRTPKPSAKLNPVNRNPPITTQRLTMLELIILIFTLVLIIGMILPILTKTREKTCRYLTMGTSTIIL